MIIIFFYYFHIKCLNKDRFRCVRYAKKTKESINVQSVQYHIVLLIVLEVINNRMENRQRVYVK